MKIKLKKPQIVAEIGLSHNGNIKKALQFVNLSKKAGADIVKFQTHYAKFESTYDEPFRIKISKKFKNRYDYWKKTEFSPIQWKQILNYCRKLNIVFATSPFSIEAVKIMRKVGCKNWKIGSGEVFSNSLMREILKKKIERFIFSTGMSNWVDINKNIKFIKKKIGNKFTILQCTTAYPNNLKNVGLNVILEMKEKYDCDVGLSDHTGSIFSPIAALSLGAEMIEVHVCDKKNSKGPDVSSSLTFEELATLSRARDAIFTMKNNPVNKNIISKKQKKLKKIFGKSIAIKNDLKKGHKIKISDLTLKKPGTGINEKFMKNIINKKAKKNLSSQRILKRGDFE
tara:strand:- start:26 stop:1048 length:1023 start_codon:yes stop_codon:yes gene_type:complete